MLGQVTRPELAAILHTGIWIVHQLQDGHDEPSIARELDLPPRLVWKLEQLHKRLSAPLPVHGPPTPPPPAPPDWLPELTLDLTSLF